MVRAPVPLDALGTLASVLRASPPFPLRLGEIARFPDRLLYVAVEPDAPVRALMRRVAAAFPDTPPYGGAIDDPIPHVTVRRCADDDECATMTAAIDAALAPCRPFELIVDRLTVHELGNDGVWRPRADLALGTAVEGGVAPG